MRKKSNYELREEEILRRADALERGEVEGLNFGIGSSSSSNSNENLSIRESVKKQAEKNKKRKISANSASSAVNIQKGKYSCYKCDWKGDVLYEGCCPNCGTLLYKKNINQRAERKESKEIVLNMWDEGVTNKSEIAKVAGCSRPTVYKILKDARKV